MRARLKAVIWDMDGVLIDSEPSWRAVEADVFGALGLTLSDAMCRETTGLRIDEVTRYWMERAPWEGPSSEEVAVRIVDAMVERVRAGGRAREGALAAVARCDGWPTALASSSPSRLIEATLARLELSFDVVVSAEREVHGKPHPQVFLSAAEALGVSPTECLVIEDSVTGVLAAKAARMTCVAAPDSEALGDPRFAIADAVVPHLDALDRELLETLGLSR